MKHFLFKYLQQILHEMIIRLSIMSKIVLKLEMITEILGRGDSEQSTSGQL